MRSIQASSRATRRRRSVLVLPLLIGAGLACELPEADFDCENAVAHLQSCCPGVQAANIDCTFVDHGGCSSTSPELDVEQSTCILDESCGSLASTGVCQRAAALTPASIWAAMDGGTGQGSPGVCP